MALQRYRTLAAMVALGEFTIKDLAERAGVTEPSVRTVVSRIMSNQGDPLVERIGTVPSGRRGGRYHLYRLTNEGERLVVAELQRLEETVLEPSRAIESEPSRANELERGVDSTDALLIAERILLEQLPTESNRAEWHALLDLASRMVRGIDDLPRSSERALGHSAATRFLLALSENEALYWKVREKLLKGLASLTRTLDERGLGLLSQEIRERVDRSVFGSITPNVSSRGLELPARLRPSPLPLQIRSNRFKKPSSVGDIGQLGPSFESPHLSLVHPVKIGSRIGEPEFQADSLALQTGRYVIDRRTGNTYATRRRYRL